MKILVTGSTGQLGLELKDIFNSKSNYSVEYLDRNMLPLDQLDLIYSTLQISTPDIIIHCGAYTAVDKAESDEEMADKVNHLASAVIAKYCSENNVKLIAISTDYVFDGTSSSPLKETAAVSPINVYGKTKLAGECVIQELLKDAIIIRTSWVYSIHGSNFVKTMIRLMNERDEISVISDQIGSPTYAYDLAKAIDVIVASDTWFPGVYNFSNEGEISWFEFAQTIKEILQLNCIVRSIPSNMYPTAARRPKYSLLDKSKIKSTYNVEVHNWKESLELMLSRLN